MCVRKLVLISLFIAFALAEIRITTQRPSFIQKDTLVGKPEFQFLMNKSNTEVHLRYQCPLKCRSQGMEVCSIFCIVDSSCFSISSSVLFFPLKNSKRKAQDDLECYDQNETNRKYLDLSLAPFYLPRGDLTDSSESHFSKTVDNFLFPSDSSYDFGNIGGTNEVLSIDLGEHFRL